MDLFGLLDLISLMGLFYLVGLIDLIGLIGWWEAIGPDFPSCVELDICLFCCVCCFAFFWMLHLVDVCLSLSF